MSTDPNLEDRMFQKTQFLDDIPHWDGLGLRPVDAIEVANAAVAEAREEARREADEQWRAFIEHRLAGAMQVAWNEWCDDLGCFPDCLAVTRGPHITADFILHPSFANGVAFALAALAPTQEPT